MSLSRLRNGKARLAVGLSLATLTLFVTYVIHDTRTKLVWTRGQVLECEHKRESLAAQLQVTGEHKSRLEKALMQEKSSHTHTKDKLESQYEELQELMDKEKQEALKKYSLLQQQMEALKTQQESLQKEFSVLQQTNSELQQEKQNLANKLTSQLDQLRSAKDEELLQLQNDYTSLLHEKEEMMKKLDKSLFIQQLEANIKECKTETTVLRESLDRLKNPREIIRPPSELTKHEKEYVVPIPNLENNHQGLKLQFDNENEKHVGPAPPLNGHNRNPSHASPHKNINASDLINDGHQLAIPVVAIDEMPANKHKDDGERRQLEVPHGHNDDVNQKKIHQLAEPPFAQIDAIGRPIRRDAELVANGLEQQENGEDQDLDNMENEVGGNDRKANDEDADFDPGDQDDNDGNRINAHFQKKEESVIAAPHK